MRNNLTVITPVGRKNRFIEEAARSLSKLREGFNKSVQKISMDWVLVADGVPVPWVADNTNDFRDKIITKTVFPDGGNAGKARNVGLSISNSEYVALLDDDDYFIPDEFLALCKHVMLNKLNWGAGNYEIFGDGNIERFDKEGLPTGPVEKNVFRSFVENFGYPPFLGGGGVIRRDLIAENGGFPILDYHQDVQMWLDINDEYPGFYTREKVYAWRRGHTQMTPRDYADRVQLWR